MRIFRKAIGQTRRTRWATLVVVVALAMLALVAAAPAALAGPSDDWQGPGSGSNDICKVGSDVRIEAGRTVDSVTVFGGDAIIAGTVRHTVVAIDGNVRLLATAEVGTRMAADDTTALAIGGTMTVLPGAAVNGTTGEWKDVSGGEVLIAGAIFAVGMAFVATIFVTLAMLALGTTVLGSILFIAAIVWLIVWLVRRSNRTQTTPPAAYATAPGATYAPTADTAYSTTPGTAYVTTPGATYPTTGTGVTYPATETDSTDTTPTASA
jgi:hypothetical protein